MLIHSHQHDTHDEIVKACQFAAEKGATRIPVSLHDGNLSDTTVMRCVVAMDAVHAKREPVQRSEIIAQYTTWLADNVDQYGAELDKIIALGGDINGWLKDRYFAVSGVRL